MHANACEQCNGELEIAEILILNRFVVSLLNDLNRVGCQDRVARISNEPGDRMPLS